MVLIVISTAPYFFKILMYHLNDERYLELETNCLTHFVMKGTHPRWAWPKA